MTLNELKAFIEGMDIPEGKQPTVDQWSRVLKKLEAVVDNKPIGTYRDTVGYPRTPSFYPEQITKCS